MAFPDGKRAKTLGDLRMWCGHVEIAAGIPPKLPDAVAERRSFDQQQFRRLRLVPVARGERPSNQAGFDLFEAVIERNPTVGRRRILGRR